MFGFFEASKEEKEREAREEREYLVRQRGMAMLKASTLMMLEMITLTAPREKVIEELLKMARTNHPELTDKHILSVLESVIPN